MADQVRLSVDGPVAKITLFRPQRGNALTTEMGLELQKALRQLQENSSIRVIILTGSGKYFCTGMDLGSSNQEEMDSLLKGGAAGRTIDVFQSIKDCPKPVICQVRLHVLKF